MACDPAIGEIRPVVHAEHAVAAAYVVTAAPAEPASAAAVTPASNSTLRSRFLGFRSILRRV